jgi:NAD(P)H-dependent FMN reductase
MAKTLDILILAGSPRRESYSRGLARRIGRALEAQGATVELFDLHETPLPMLDPALRSMAEEHPDPAVARLNALVARSAAFVLVSPVYHNSYSGPLKNALDHLGPRNFDARPVGLASHGGRSSQAVDHLRQVVRALYGVTIPTQVCTGREDYEPAPTAAGPYRLKSEEILERVDRFAEELVGFARKLSSDGA